MSKLTRNGRNGVEFEGELEAEMLWRASVLREFVVDLAWVASPSLIGGRAQQEGTPPVVTCGRVRSPDPGRVLLQVLLIKYELRITGCSHRIHTIVIDRVGSSG